MVRPIDALSATNSYAIPPRPSHIDLPLGNTERLFMSTDEENALDDAWRKVAREAAGHYPDARPLEAAIAEVTGVEPAQVIVTAGADEALERACKAVLQPGRNLLLPIPTFAMIPHYAKLTGAEVRQSRVARTVSIGGQFVHRAILRLPRWPSSRQTIRPDVF